MQKITLSALEKGCARYWKHEPRDAMYRIAEKLVEEGWNKPNQVADGLGVVLLTWNQAAYRYGSFDFDALEEFVRKNKKALNLFRGRHIGSFHVEEDAATVLLLFDEALDALAYTKKKRRTPVAVAKALHMLAPSFFPLWDQKIARGCGCYWGKHKKAASKYVDFMAYAKAAIASLEQQFTEGQSPASLPDARYLDASLSKHARRRKTMLKFLDEYLYSRYTKSWWG